MVRLILKLYWKLSGWKITGSFPHHLKKMVIAVAPHTSKEDVMVGFAARRELNIPHAKFLGKQELFKGPLGWVLRKLGGTPVDRFSKHGVVDQAAALFAGNEDFLLALAPEGTRKGVSQWKSGFYHIAVAARVPILPVGFDYREHVVRLMPLFHPSGDLERDLPLIQALFEQVHGLRERPAGS